MSRTSPLKEYSLLRLALVPQPKGSGDRPSWYLLAAGD